MPKRKWTVVIEEGKDGYIVATVAELPTVVTEGKTREEALANAKEAIELYSEYLNDVG